MNGLKFQRKDYLIKPSTLRWQGMPVNKYIFKYISNKYIILFLVWFWGQEIDETLSLSWRLLLHSPVQEGMHKYPSEHEYAVQM